jgi:hypothetical protein
MWGGVGADGEVRIVALHRRESQVCGLGVLVSGN